MAGAKLRAGKSLREAGGGVDGEGCTFNVWVMYNSCVILADRSLVERRTLTRTSGERRKDIQQRMSEHNARRHPFGLSVFIGVHRLPNTFWGQWAVSGEKNKGRERIRIPRSPRRERRSRTGKRSEE